MRKSLSALIFLSLFPACNQIPENATPDMKDYFKKKTYTPTPLPIFANSKALLPSPILEGNPGWIDMYWTCWEIAFRGLKQPPEGSPLVSNWLDEAFSENIFQWDTIFMMLFARYGHEAFPAIQSLDNFYALQHKSGYIGREYREKDGKLIHFDHGGGLFAETGYKNTINPPLFSWAEVESFRITGDKSRFEKVLPALESYADFLNRDGDPDALDWQNQGRISKTTQHRLYWNTPLGSGMDNTPRPAKKGAGWVEMSAQMVINYNNLAIIAAELGMQEKAHEFEEDARAIARRINQWCWNEEDGFYYDVLSDGTQFLKKTIGGFWPLLAGVASRDQANRLVAHLKDKEKFWRPVLFPTLSADEEEYEEYGGYWLGGVWAPTNVVIIKGLERYGYEDLAAESTEKYLAAMYKVYKDSGTVYENYAPEHIAPGDPSKPDFVGWTGCGPIQLLFENVMGLRPDGVNNALLWNIRRTDRHGVENLKLGNNSVSLVCEAAVDSKKRTIKVDCKKAFKLCVQSATEIVDFELPAGEHTLKI